MCATSALSLRALDGRRLKILPHESAAISRARSGARDSPRPPSMSIGADDLNKQENRAGDRSEAQKAEKSDNFNHDALSTAS